MTRVEVARVPERGAEYGKEVWQRIQSQVIAREPRRGFSWAALLGPRPVALAGAMAVLLVAAFFAGRYSPHPEQPQSAAHAQQGRDRILFVAVGEHFERSRMVLVELVNSPEGVPVNMSNSRQWAEDLVESNRLYRQTAMQAGDQGLSSVLDELERVLLEVAHSPDQVSPGEFDALRKRIESRGILFKLRVVETQMDQRQKRAAPGAAGRTRL